MLAVHSKSLASKVLCVHHQYTVRVHQMLTDTDNVSRLQWGSDETRHGNRDIVPKHDMSERTTIPKIISKVARAQRN